MNVFVSSLIAGMAPIREAARAAITTLRHAPVMAEDFGAQPRSPQVACLGELRRSDLVVLVLGEQYGLAQPSGLSATHEEYREARGTKPVVAFVQEGITPEPRQADFIREVQSWEGGLFRGGFATPAELQVAIIRALHDLTLSNAIGPVDEASLAQRAVALLPQERQHFSTGVPMLNLGVAGGPTQTLLRPSEMEDPLLWDSLHQAALFGSTRVFDQAKGVEKELDGSAFILRQERDGALFRLDEDGGMLVRAAFDQEKRGQRGYGGLAVILEDDVQHVLSSSLGLAASALDRIDATQRVTHVALALSISGGDGRAWRTRAEHEASPNSMTVGFSNADRAPIQVFRPRAALRLDVARLVEDLAVMLRRTWHH